MQEAKTKTSARTRTAVITIKYHYTTAGRRGKLRQELVGSVLAAIVRRLERNSSLMVDSIGMEEF